MHLCRCAIQVLGDAFSSIVSITPMAACPKPIPLIVDILQIQALSEESASFRVRLNTGFTVLKTFHVNWRV